MANRFLNNIRINDAYTFPASDGNDGQVITTDGAGNLGFENISPDAASVIYRDNFTGDGSTVAFDLQNSITDEDQTQIFIDGVYQEKSTYSISGTTITFTTAPILGHSVEVISISSINTGPTVLYQDNFTGNGSDTAFTLGQAIDNEIKTFIFLNGVYQFKNTYTVDGTTLTFDAAPANGVAIEVVSIASAVQSDSLEAGSIIIPVKNTHSASISKGTPVYITGNVGASERLQIAPADASNSAKMPAAGLLLTTLAVNAQGYAITGGYLRNLTTDTIDGTSTTSNDTVYVKAGGGLTMTKPTGSNLIQNIAKIARSASGSSGSLIVSSILRTNDIPNLTTGKIWVGDSNTTESTVVHLDESNNRLGINNNSPSYSLDVTGTANVSGALTVSGGDVILGGTGRIQGVDTVSTGTDAVNKTYVDTQVAGIVDSAPATLDTLNELAAALGDDANFSTTVTNSIALKAPLASPSFTGNVGIGVTPNASYSKLQIKTPTSSYGFDLIGRDAGSNSESQITFWNSAQSSVLAAIFNITDNLYFTTGTTERMVITNSGNVGIGTTSPSAKLDVKAANTAATTDYATKVIKAVAPLVGGYTGTKIISLLGGFDGTIHAVDFGYGYNGTGYDIMLSTNDNTTGDPIERMRIDSSGNVGIGNANPQTNLTIGSAQGNSLEFTYDSTNGYRNIISNHWDSSTDTRMDFNIGRTGNVAPVPVMSVGYGSNVGIGTTSPDYNLEIEATDAKAFVHYPSASRGGIAAYSSQRIAFTTTGSSDDLVFGYNNGVTSTSANFVEHMRIDNGTGNVGIATTSPDAKLDIHSSGSWGQYGRGSSGDINVENTNTSVTEGGWIGISGYTGNSANNGYYPMAGITAKKSTTAADGNYGADLSFWVTAGSGQSGEANSGMYQRMTINRFGNVGIGTDSPGTKLELYGDTSSGGFGAYPALTIKNDNASGFSAVHFNQSTSQKARIEVSNSAGSMGLYTTSAANGILINNSGNVGIGTTSPSNKLDVIGNVLVQGTQGFNAANETANLYLGDTNSVIRAEYDVGTHIMTNNQQRLTVRGSTGNVGIGTTSPSGLTHFYGNGNSTYIVNQKNSTKWSEWHVGGTNHAFIWDSTADMRFMTATSLNGGGASEKMRITSGGYVGIGNTSGAGARTKLGVTFGVTGNAANLAESVSYAAIEMYPYRNSSTYGMFVGGMGLTSGYIQSANTNGTAAGAFSINPWGGNVGIGVTSPGHKLDVYQGRIALTGLAAGGSGHYIALSGQLPGYSANLYNCLETNLNDLHFAAGGVYTGYISYNGGFTDVSDISLKENIEDIPDALNKVNNLRGRYFTWKNELQGNDKQIGFIAQEVEEYIPEVVTSGAGGTKGIAYGKMTALLVNAIKELKADNDSLKARIETLENN